MPLSFAGIQKWHALRVFMQVPILFAVDLRDPTGQGDGCIWHNRWSTQASKLA